MVSTGSGTDDTLVSVGGGVVAEVARILKLAIASESLEERIKMLERAKDLAASEASEAAS